MERKYQGGILERQSDLPPPDLHDLVARTRAGDLRAFDEVERIVRRRLHARARTILKERRNPALAVDDVVQETLFRALQGLEGFNWEGEEPFYRWLFEIARRVTLAMARESRRAASLGEDAEIPARDVSPSRTVSREERFHRLQAALRGLRPEDREVIILARIEGLTTREIEARTGRSYDAVRQLLSRALKKLSRAFGDTGSLGLPRDARFGDVLGADACDTLDTDGHPERTRPPNGSADRGPCE